MTNEGDDKRSKSVLKFIVDAMLGDVARWLRLLGYDTVYARNMPDWRIIEIALKDGRIIITRDRGLYIRSKKKGAQAFLVEAETTAERLAVIAKKLDIDLNVDPNKSRCPLCNAPLRKVEKEDVRERVPPKVYEIYSEFWVCTRCGQVYWRGSHWRGIEATIREAQRLARRGR